MFRIFKTLDEDAQQISNAVTLMNSGDLTGIARSI